MYKHRNTLQHTTLCYDTLQRTATHGSFRGDVVHGAARSCYCNMLKHTAIHRNSLTTYYIALQHTAHLGAMPCMAPQDTVATHCSTLQLNTATHYCNCTLQLFTATHHCNTLLHTATHYTTLQRTAHLGPMPCVAPQDTVIAANCSTLQYIATLQHTTPHCNILQHTATHCSLGGNAVRGAARVFNCNTLQHTPTHCNTLQHTATHCNTRLTWGQCRAWRRTRLPRASAVTSRLLFPHGSWSRQ